MGWVIFRRIYEDEFCVIYTYSHDSHEHDGEIRLTKADLRPEKTILEMAEITPSRTDHGKFFAIRAAAFLLTCLLNGEPLPDTKMLAYG